MRETEGADNTEPSHPTNSSAGVRDYIHVVDLAKGHIAALRKLKDQCGCRVGRERRSKGGEVEFRARGAQRGGYASPFHSTCSLLGRSTTWEQARAIRCCRWSGPWRRPPGGRWASTLRHPPDSQQ